MVQHKSATPLAVIDLLTDIENSKSYNRAFIRNITSTDLLHLESDYLDQTFYFKITKSAVHGSNVTFSVEFMPYSNLTFNVQRPSCDINSLKTKLNYWSTLVEGYHKSRIPFINNNDQFYEDEFKSVLDIEKIENPDELLSLEKQEKLITLLDRIVNFSEKEITEERVKDFLSLKDQTELLVGEIHHLTAQEIAERLTPIFGRLWGFGARIFSDIVGNIATIKLLELFGNG